MESLSICLLGTPRVTVDGAPWSVDTRKATGLLAFLAVTGHAHSRAVVANLLWPDSATEQSRNTLRRTLSTLRAALGEGRVVGDRDSIALNLDGAWFDLAAFRRVAGDPDADVAALIKACELHRDDLLAGFGLRDSPAFDDWQRDCADAIRRERAALLDRLVERLTGAGRFDDAVACARQRLGLDPLHEPTHRRLIEVYAAAGRRGDAIAQYRECVRVLDRELAVAPLSATTAVYDAVSTGTTIPVAAEQPPPSPAGELPLVGRDAELRRLTEAFDTIADDGAVIVIEGESGVGKTRLAGEAIGGLARVGARVITARAHTAERGLAYGVLAQLLQAAIGSSDEPLPSALRGELARLLPALGAAPAGDLERPGARLRFLEAACGVIAGDSRRTGTVAFVDDLQWCDPASLDALAYLARRLRGRRLLLLCARRTDEPDPGATPRVPDTGRAAARARSAASRAGSRPCTPDGARPGRGRRALPRERGAGCVRGRAAAARTPGGVIGWRPRGVPGATRGDERGGGAGARRGRADRPNVRPRHRPSGERSPRGRGRRRAR